MSLIFLSFSFGEAQYGPRVINLQLYSARELLARKLPAEVFSSITYHLVLFLFLLTAAVPSAPSAIALLLCTGSEMVLGWRAPARHGGDPVLEYYLDQREKGGKTWREVNVKPAKKRQFKVGNAPEGCNYSVV